MKQRQRRRARNRRLARFPSYMWKVWQHLNQPPRVRRDPSLPNPDLDTDDL